MPISASFGMNFHTNLPVLLDYPILVALGNMTYLAFDMFLRSHPLEMVIFP